LLRRIEPRGDEPLSIFTCAITSAAEAGIKYKAFSFAALKRCTTQKSAVGEATFCQEDSDLSANAD